MRYVCTLITVADIGRSRAFYEGVLGQKVMFDHGANVAFEGGFAIHDAAHFASLIDRSTPAGRTDCLELYFEDDAVDACAERLAAAGAEFVHPVREQPWRQRVVRVRDPDGHIVEVGESMEAVARRLGTTGLSPAAIAAAISMDEAFVRAALAAGS